MTRDQALAVIRTVIGRVAPEADLTEVEGGVELQTALDLDSMDFLNVVAGIEQETGVDIPERDYPRVATIDGFVDYLAAA